jgi:hypothetical protein
MIPIAFCPCAVGVFFYKGQGRNPMKKKNKVIFPKTVNGKNFVVYVTDVTPLYERRSK